MKNTKSGALLAAMFLLGACASTGTPHGELSSAKSAISAAEAKGAQDVPQASLYLKMARDGVNRAETLIEEDKFRDAVRVLDRAELDAELAASLAEEEEVKVKAHEQLDRVKSLRQSHLEQSGADAQGSSEPNQRTKGI